MDGLLQGVVEGLVVGAALLHEKCRPDGLGEARLVALGDRGTGVGVGREEVLPVAWD